MNISKILEVGAKITPKAFQQALAELPSVRWCSKPAEEFDIVPFVGRAWEGWGIRYSLETREYTVLFPEWVKKCITEYFSGFAPMRGDYEVGKFIKKIEKLPAASRQDIAVVGRKEWGKLLPPVMEVEAKLGPVGWGRIVTARTYSCESLLIGSLLKCLEEKITFDDVKKLFLVILELEKKVVSDPGMSGAGVEVKDDESLVYSSCTGTVVTLNWKTEVVTFKGLPEAFRYRWLRTVGGWNVRPHVVSLTWGGWTGGGCDWD